MKGQLIKNIALRHLQNIGLAEHAGKYPYTLSGGMRQRVAIARVLALEPKVLLMDEPFSALDANSRERLQDELVLRIWVEHRRTVVYVTHSVEEVAYLAERIIVMGNGEATILMEIANMQPHPRNRSSSQFLAMKDSLRERLAAQPCCIVPKKI